MSAAPTFTVTEVALARRACQTRLPFRFGEATLERADMLTCRVTIRGPGGQSRCGWSADLLAPRWFRKDTDATPQEDAEELFDSVVASARAFVDQSGGAVFDLWRGVMRARVDPFPFDAPDQLVRGFGVALVERALLDASARFVGLSFARALRDDVFGFRPGAVHASLARWDWRGDLPTPVTRVAVRHTVGMLDPLRATDLADADRIHDGLPETLAEDLDTYGGAWLKVKIGAGVDRDRERLLDLARFCVERDQAFGFSLDGNEQYEDLDEVLSLLQAVAAEPVGARLLKGLAWIEQPLSRQHTFDPQRHRSGQRVADFAPLLIDEADAAPRSFERARELGYRGVSVKSCKGVFRALCNFGICQGDAALFQSGEDLTNVGVLALQQDLVIQSVLGSSHVERNGHRYFRGLDHLPGDVARRALSDHADLYRELDVGAALRIQRGAVDATSSLQSVGFGTAMDDWGLELETVAER